MDEMSNPAGPEAGFTEKFVEADGFDIRYREAGEGPAVVALHGGGGSRISGAHALLSENFRVLAVEAPGFGNSDENTRHRTMFEMADTLHAAIAALGIAAFSIIGNSFGGRVALCMAARNPEPIEALVLVGPAAIREGGAVFERNLRSILGVGPAAVREGGAAPSRADGSHENMEALMYAHPENMPPLPRPDPEIARKQAALIERLHGPDRDGELEARMREIDTPTLVLLGTEDKLIPPRIGRLYREIMPRCHVVMIYDAGHAMDAERPEAVASVAGDFIARRDEFLIKRTDGAIHP